MGSIAAKHWKRWRLNAGGGTFLADAGTGSTLSGVISGSGSVTKAGPGSLTLTGANSYSGGTSLNGGILAVDSDGNLGTGALSFNGGHTDSDRKRSSARLSAAGMTFVLSIQSLA